MHQPLHLGKASASCTKITAHTVPSALGGSASWLSRDSARATMLPRLMLGLVLRFGAASRATSSTATISATEGLRAGSGATQRAHTSTTACGQSRGALRSPAHRMLPHP